MESKTEFLSSCKGGALVEAAVLLPLLIVIVFFLFELYFTITLYFAARDGFSLASRRLSLPLTVLTLPGDNKLPRCSVLAELIMTKRIEAFGRQLTGIKVAVSRIASNAAKFEAAVGNRCVLCDKIGITLPLTFDFASKVDSQSGDLGCLPDGEV